MLPRNCWILLAQARRRHVSCRASAGFSSLEPHSVIVEAAPVCIASAAAVAVSVRRFPAASACRRRGAFNAGAARCTDRAIARRKTPEARRRANGLVCEAQRPRFTSRLPSVGMPVGRACGRAAEGGGDERRSGSAAEPAGGGAVSVRHVAAAGACRVGTRRPRSILPGRRRADDVRGGQRGRAAWSRPHRPRCSALRLWPTRTPCNTRWRPTGSASCWW